ncbi:MAG: cation transporter [Aquihabitans sp.]
MSNTTATYKVQGMTCGHCVSSVTTELGRIDGVTGVDVHLASGNVSISSAGPIPHDAVVAAVDEAGYEVVS